MFIDTNNIEGLLRREVQYLVREEGWAFKDACWKVGIEESFDIMESTSHRAYDQEEIRRHHGEVDQRRSVEDDTKDKGSCVIDSKDVKEHHGWQFYMDNESGHIREIVHLWPVNVWELYIPKGFNSRGYPLDLRTQFKDLSLDKDSCRWLTNYVRKVVIDDPMAFKVHKISVNGNPYWTYPVRLSGKIKKELGISKVVAKCGTDPTII